MDQASRMHSADRCRECSGDAQERRYLQRPAEQPLKRLAAGILEHQRHAIVLAAQRDWPRRPGSIKFGFERIFMLEPLE